MRIHPQGVIADHSAEDEESDHLENDTGHHEIIADFLHIRAVIGCGRNPSTGSLYDEGEKISEAEDPGVKLGSNAGEVGAELEGNVFEGEVHAGGDEGRGNDETTDLDFESIIRPRVAVKHDSSHIAWRECQQWKERSRG